jgi:hypothetical protein
LEDPVETSSQIDVGRKCAQRRYWECQQAYVDQGAFHIGYQQMARAVRQEFIFESAAYPPTSVNPQAEVHVISRTGELSESRSTIKLAVEG